jgi:hypothetical protein
LKKTLIAIFSIVALPLGLVVGVSATEPNPNQHNVSYTVLPLRAISVETRSGSGTTAIDFGTIAKSASKTNTDLQLRFTAQDAVASGTAVKITAGLNTSLEQATLKVTPGAISGDSNTATLGSAVLLSNSAANVISAAHKSGGFNDVTSELTYLLETDSNSIAATENVTVTYTLSNNTP